DDARSPLAQGTDSHLVTNHKMNIAVRPRACQVWIAAPESVRRESAGVALSLETAFPVKIAGVRALLPAEGRPSVGRRTPLGPASGETRVQGHDRTSRLTYRL